jgi:predicted O-methyltransferase YrrM
MRNDYSAWFAGKNFSTDWTSKRFGLWTSLFSARRDKIFNVLEIGAWEGRSAIFFLNFFPHCTVTSIDTFAGSSEHIDDPEWSELIAGCEQRFDANLAEYGPRSEKIKARSCLGLASLATSLRSFDFIYVDGSHHSSDVYIDSAASWPLLVRGGILIFDDYEWPGRPTEVECPKLGVDAFLASHAGHYRELHRGYEIVIEKT